MQGANVLNNNVDSRNLLKDTTTIRIGIHKYIYSREDMIAQLSNMILSLDIFGIESFDPINKTFILKVKKTNIKKKYNHSHSAIFYYNIFNEIIYNFLKQNIEEVYKLLDTEFVYPVDRQFIDNLIKIENIPLIYNTQAILDNMVMLIL